MRWVASLLFSSPSHTHSLLWGGDVEVFFRWENTKLHRESGTPGCLQPSKYAGVASLEDTKKATDLFCCILVVSHGVFNVIIGFWVTPPAPAGGDCLCKPPDAGYSHPSGLSREDA